MAIYFIQDGYGNIKIGYSKNPTKRIGQLNTGNPTDLTLIGYTDGDEQLESEIHKRFAINRMNGEWFKYTEELAEFIHQLIGVYPENLGSNIIEVKSRHIVKGRLPSYKWQFIFYCIFSLFGLIFVELIVHSDILLDYGVSNDIVILVSIVGLWLSVIAVSYFYAYVRACERIKDALTGQGVL